MVYNSVWRSLNSVAAGLMANGLLQPSLVICIYII